MQERPIIFNSEMVRAILDGRKTQTRRVIQPRIGNKTFDICKDINGIITDIQAKDEEDSHIGTVKCSYGQPGDILYVRERFGFGPSMFCFRDRVMHYYADCKDTRLVKKWKPSIHMPKKYARIWLKIKDIRVERVQDISEEDAKAEGIELYNNYDGTYGGWGAPTTYKESFKCLWNSINGKPRKDGVDISWAANPWIWVVEFEIYNK